MADRKIKITVAGESVVAILSHTPTADKVWEALPFTESANTWGEEIYFSIPVKIAADRDAHDVVSMGDIAYWPPGSAFCIFFGMTPASSGGVIRAASPVNVFGRIEGDPLKLKKARSGDEVLVEQMEV